MTDDQPQPEPAPAEPLGVRVVLTAEAEVIPGGGTAPDEPDDDEEQR